MKLSLVSGLCVMAVMLTPQTSSAATFTHQSMLPTAQPAAGSLVNKATHYRRYDDEDDGYRRRYGNGRDDSYRRRYGDDRYYSYRDRRYYDDRDHSYRRRYYDDRYYRYDYRDRSYDRCRWVRHKCASRWGWGGYDYRRCLWWRGCVGGGSPY